MPTRRLKLRLRGLAVGLALLVLSACGSSARPAPQAHAFGVPSLATLARSAAADSDEFLLRQNGADFASDWASNRCNAMGTHARFTPAFGSGSAELTDVAFALYRLTYDPLQLPVELELAFGATSPAAGSCWIGLSEWGVSRWNWQLLPADGKLMLDNPNHYLDPQQHCYIAVVMLGGQESMLSTIGFGELPSSAGYTLVPPFVGPETHLIDMDGNIAHTWVSPYTPGATAELLLSGHLLRTANLENPNFQLGGGRGGRLEQYDWDNNLVWSYDLNSTTQCSHHDFEVLPSGNILLVAWTQVENLDIINAGRDPALLEPDRFWYDCVVEVEPTLPSGGNIVWEWHALDHVIQDFAPGMDNYGDPALHPELLDLNYPPVGAGDWLHVNSVSYNAELDQIMLTSPDFKEVWVIDHTTTSAEAAAHTGGVYGRGGDLLYRWGNPAAYRAGSGSDQQLFYCHDGHWIADGLAGSSQIMVFNNNGGTLEGRQYSTVVQIIPPLNPDGSYVLDGQRYGPDELSWEYKADPPELFYSPILSSAQRLPGGGTLICTGATGVIFELDADGALVWEYHNKFPAEFTAPVFKAFRYPADYPGLDNL